MKRQALYMTVAMILAIMVLLVLISRGTFGGRIKQLATLGFAGSEYSLTAYTVEWCPHCQHFKPELAKLGSSQTVNGKTVSIISIDPEAEPSKKNPAVKGYPTVFFSGPSGEKEYTGERTAEAITAFLKENVSA